MIFGMTVGELVTVLSFVTIASGIVFSMFKLWSRFQQLEKRSNHRQEDTAMMFTCLRGCLEGMIEAGYNGPVKSALKELNEYTASKAAGLPGRGK